jgi:hypothetical protein
VRGIDALSRGIVSDRPQRSRARRAAICAIVPGGGAVYNNQGLKAVFHFVSTVVLLQLSVIDPFAAFFVLAAAAFYMYSIIDAYRTAEAISRGENPRSGEEKLKRSLLRYGTFLGLGLIICGVLLFIHLVAPFGLDLSLLQLKRIAPVALVLLGGFLIVSHIRRGRRAAEWAPPHDRLLGQGGQSWK